MGHDQNNRVRMKPILNDILGACLRPKNVVLQVRSLVQRTTGSHSREDFAYDGSVDGWVMSRTTRLFLTDGELVIQAVLSSKIASSFTVDDFRVGNFIEVRNFDVKKARRKNGDGWVVYLNLKACVVHYNYNHNTDPHTLRVPEKLDSNTSDTEIRRDYADLQDTAGGFVREEDDDGAAFDDPVPQPGFPGWGPAASDVKRKAESATSSDEDDAFETNVADLYTAKRRRQTLVELSQHDNKVAQIAPARHAGSSGDRTAKKKKKVTFALELDDDLLPDQDAQSEKVSHDFDRTRKDPDKNPPRLAGRRATTVFGSLEPPLHSLASLIYRSPGHSLPRKNYTLNAFAVITYVGGSVISRPGSAFPPKRNIKIEDPSLHRSSNNNNRHTNDRRQQSSTAAVTVAIYRDALHFKPAVGTIALLRGLVMQRLPNREIILNKYAASNSSKITKQENVDVDTLSYQRRQQQYQQQQERLRRQRQIPINSGNPVDGALTVESEKPNEVEGKEEEENDDDDDDKVIKGQGKEDSDNEPSPPVVLDDDDWFITSPNLLTELGLDHHAMQTWWEQRNHGGIR